MFAGLRLAPRQAAAHVCVCAFRWAFTVAARRSAVAARRSACMAARRHPVSALYGFDEVQVDAIMRKWFACVACMEAAIRVDGCCMLA